MIITLPSLEIVQAFDIATVDTEVWDVLYTFTKDKTDFIRGCDYVG